MTSSSSSSQANPIRSSSSTARTRTSRSNRPLLKRKRSRPHALPCVSSCCYGFSSLLSHATSALALFDWRTEALLTCQLALPTVIIQWSFVVPPFWASSVIGRSYGTVALDAFSLAWGAGNLSTLALLQGIFNACDTLGPRAFGAGDYRQVGLVSMRGLVTSVVVVIVPMHLLLWGGTLSWVWKALGQDPAVTEQASLFYQTYATCYPFYALYAILWKFLAAQDKGALWPMVISTLVGTFGLLPLCLNFGMHVWGFVGVGYALMIFYVLQCVMVLTWLHWRKGPHHPETWPGGSWSVWRHEVLTPNAYLTFLALSFGGMLAYLEWIYWEVLTVIIGTFGVLPLSAHTLPRQVTDIGYVLPLGLAIALSIRLGATLPKSVSHAKNLALVAFSFSVAVFGLISLLMYLFRDAVVVMFTSDNSVIDICNDIWLSACLYFFFFSMFGISSGISVGLGIQMTFGLVTVTCMWLIGMPATYYFAVTQTGGLTAVWQCIWPPYLFINLCMVIIFYRKDWGDISRALPIASTDEQKIRNVEPNRRSGTGIRNGFHNE